MSRTVRRKNELWEIKINRDRVKRNICFMESLYYEYSYYRKKFETFEDLVEHEWQEHETFARKFKLDGRRSNAPSWYRRSRNSLYRHRSAQEIRKCIAKHEYDIVIGDPKSDVNYYWF